MTVLDDLKETKIWINYRLKEEEGKTTKVPIAFDGTSVGTTPKYQEKWCDYKTAKVQVDDCTANGMGLILCPITFDNQKRLALSSIDIDNRDLNDIITQDIITTMNTYTEKSPSGNGFHLFCLVDSSKLPENYNEQYYMKNPHINVEAYVGGITSRFMTFTGNVVVDKDIEERTEQFIQFLNNHMYKNIDFSNVENDNTVTTCIEDNSVPQSNNFIIDTILKTKQADKFNKLFFLGDTSDYDNDDSSADMSLASILAFYIGPNEERIDKLMRQSKLYRSKWERTDYREMTIKKAIALCEGKFFNWNQEELQEESKNYNVTINSFTANEIMQLDLKPLEPVIKNLLYPGFSILAGAPKVGKSWLCMDIALSVCNCNEFLEFETNKSGVLYLALEDSFNRIKDRMKKVLGENQTAPDNLHIATTCNPLDEGFLSELQNTLNENPDIKLIIIDTLQKVRGAQVRGETWYASDYKEVAKLKKFADFNKVCILAIHHLRKQKDSDPFNQISGSSRITASDLIKKIKDLTGVIPRQKSPQALSREINEHLQYDLWNFDRIFYEQGNKNGGNKGREMYFYKKEQPNKYEIETQLEEDTITNNNEDDDTM